ncbi:hypothetical protein [Qipengyuania sp. ASV99]|uniref:hypothetical protein n=1 Tax=Qipengyuania sp. ASV99 TaxID=3399681 RepID=UPI003A4C6E41
MPRLANSRFNPAPGVKDFWSEFRKPNPYRVPILLASTAPFALIFYWLAGETVYKVPDPPTITYITTFDAARSDAEIIASNVENQEVKDLREAREAEIAERKRELYKALGAAAGMDVEEIERRADARRAAEAAAEQARREELFGRGTNEQADDSEAESTAAPPPAVPDSESPAP